MGRQARGGRASEQRTWLSDFYYYSSDGKDGDNWVGLGYVFEVELIGFLTAWVSL